MEGKNNRFTSFPGGDLNKSIKEDELSLLDTEDISDSTQFAYSKVREVFEKHAEKLENIRQAVHELTSTKKPRQKRARSKYTKYSKSPFTNSNYNDDYKYDVFKSPRKQKELNKPEEIYDKIISPEKLTKELERWNLTSLNNLETHDKTKAKTRARSVDDLSRVALFHGANQRRNPRFVHSMHPKKRELVSSSDESQNLEKNDGRKLGSRSSAVYFPSF